MNDLKKGQTGINEHARRILDISRDEYAFCSYVLYRQADAKQLRRGFCCDPKQEVAEFVGVSRQGLYKMIDRMETAKLMEVQPNGDLATMPRFTQIESNGKESLQSKINGTVNLVDSKCKLSLQPSVNLVTGNKEVLDRNKIEEKEYNVGEKNADGETFLIKTFEEVKLPSLEAKKGREEKPSPTVPGDAKPKPNKPCANLEDCYKHFSDPAAIRKTFEGWLLYKRQMKHGYKLECTKITALRNLYKWSAGNVDLAAQIISTSIDNEYRGLFEPKKQNPIAEKKPYAPPAYRHEAPPASTAQAGYVE